MKNKISDFIFEASALKSLQRTGWQILGGNEESIAEHSFMAAVIAYTLAAQIGADKEKAALMALFHDLGEARTGDVYKLADLYVSADNVKATKDALAKLPDSGIMEKLFSEYEEEKTLESKIVHDADTLALVVELKKMMENGNENAKEWFGANYKCLHLDISKEVFKDIEKGNSQDWWKKEREKIHGSF